MRDLMQRSLGVGISLRVSASPSLPPAKVDPNQLELALLNLCVNSRDAMGENGSLTIEVRKADETDDLPPGLAEGAYIRISVSRHGLRYGRSDFEESYRAFLHN